MPSLKGWQTWLSHALIAAVVTFVASLWLTPWMGALLATWGYLWREADQLYRKFARGAPLRKFDMAMDVVAPALAAVIVAILLC